MTPKNVIRSLLALILFASITGCSSKMAVDSPSPLTGCYSATVGADRAYLNVTETSGAVRGTLEYAFTQKDSSWGLITGTATQSRIDVEYQYLSEGLLSTRRLALNRDGEKLSGEGWTYTRAKSCQFGAPWQSSEVSKIKVDTFHDPETGYYVRARFTIAGPSSGYTYRCHATAFDKEKQVQADWISSAATDSSTALRLQGMQTNIRPDQVDLIDSAIVECQTKG